jgi:hypothetical protein
LSSIVDNGYHGRTPGLTRQYARDRRLSTANKSGSCRLSLTIDNRLQ